MRALTSFLPLLALVALPLAAAMPYHTGTGHTKQDFDNISNQLARRAYFTDMSQFDFKPFNVTELTIRCNRANLTAHYLCNLTFNWFDPNSVKQNRVTSGSCQIDWPWDGVTKYNASVDGSNPVAGYRACWIDQSTYFHTAIPGFWHPGNFSIELAHHYRDDENFTIPWNYPTTFAIADIRICGDEILQNNIYHYAPAPINGTVFGLTD